MGTEDVSPFSGWIQASFDNTPDSGGTGSSGTSGLKLNPQGGTVSTGAGLNVAGNIQAGGLTILDQQQKIYLTDNAGGTNDPDYLIQVDGGQFLIYDVTNTSNKILINADGHIDILPNTDFGAGIDVTGNSTFSNTVTGTIFKVPDATNVSGATNHIAVGDNSDLKLYHDNNGDAQIFNSTGHLTIVNNTSGKVINLQPKSGANGVIARYEGAVELYHNGEKRIETASSGVLLPDMSTNKGRLAFGDFGTRIEGGAGAGADDGLYFMTNSVMKWQMNPDGDLIPSTAGAVDIGSATAEIGNVYIADDKKVFLGSDQDFTLHHNNAHAIIKNTTGRLYLLSDDLWFKNQADNSNLARFLNGDTSIFYHAGNEKFRTHTTGILVTGEVATSQEYPDIQPTFDANFAASRT